MSNRLKNSWKRFTASVPLVSHDMIDHRNSPVTLSVNELQTLGSLPGAISICSADGEVVWMNDEFHNCFGLSAEQGFSFNLQQLVMKDCLPELFAMTADVTAYGNPQCHQVKPRVRKPDDAERQVELRVSRYFSHVIEKEVPLLLVMASDCKVRANNTPDTISSDAMHAEPMTKLLAETSHEMRTPLNAIIGFAEMLDGKAGQVLEPSKQAEYARLIATTARQMLEMTGDLIDLSKLRSGNWELQPETLDTPEIVGHVVSSLQPVLLNKGVLVEVDATEHLPAVNADNRALRQILVNLISNACKFSKPGGEVLIDITRSFRSVNIAITDFGCGISPGALRQLGKEYFREENVGCIEGSGLGLSIVYRLLDQMNGELSVESVPGKGSTFTVSMPIAVKPAKPVPANPDGDVVYLKPNTASHRSANASIPMNQTKQKLA